MSPLAYTDMYLVTSISDELEGRVKCEYVISRDNNKVFCSLLSKEETIEETGVTVSFDIKENDINLLCKYVKDNLMFMFNVPINIDGELYPHVNIKHKGTNYYQIENAGPHTKLTGLIGGLPNSIKLYDYKNYMDISIYQTLERIGYRTNLAFDIEIGAVDQSADKDIQMSEKTKLYIAKRLTEVIKEFKKYVFDEIHNIDSWDEVYRFLDSNSFLLPVVLWKNERIKVHDWLNSKVGFHKTKKGNIVQDGENERNPFCSKAYYYYNDIGFIPTVKSLLNYFTNLENIYIVDEIDNNIYNLKPLSSVVPITIKPPAAIKKTRNPSNNKCYRLSHYPGTIGRELNIDKTKSYYYVSMDVYNKPRFNNDLRFQLLTYIQSDIYVVNDVSLVGDTWIDLIETINQKCKDLDTNFFSYIEGINGRVINYMPNKQAFIRENPDSIISKFLLQSIEYSKYSYSFYRLISSLHNDEIINIKEAEVPLETLIEEIDVTYPLLEKSLRVESYSIETYIKQVDNYNTK